MCIRDRSISRENLLAGFVAGVIGKGGAMDMMKAQEYMRTPVSYTHLDVYKRQLQNVFDCLCKVIYCNAFGTHA